MQFHLHELSRFARSLDRRRRALLGLLVLAGLSLVLLFAAAVDAWINPLREGTAFGMLTGTLLLVAGGTVLLARHYHRHHRIGLRRLAARIERAYPELNDRLTTAAHLDRTLQREPNALEQTVLAEARARLEKLDWRAHALRGFERPRAVATMASLSLLLLIGAAVSNPISKAGFHLRDLLAGQSTGLLIEPDAPEIPRGTDFSFSIQVNRWQQEAEVLLKDPDGSVTREPVVLNPAGEGRFTLYGVDQATRYRVQSPSLRSPWLTAEVFDPPKLEQLQLTIEPPAYTGLPARTESGLADTEVVEGSRLAFTAEAPAAVRGQLLLGEQVLPLQQNAATLFTAEVSVSNSSSLRLAFADAAGRRHVTPEAQLRVIPDEPPVVEILQPGEDATAVPEGVLDLELYAADDYGLADARLHLRVSGEAAGSVDLKLTGEPREFTFAEPFLLEDLPLEDGDILSLYLEATDNRQPAAQSSRTDLRFVEIRVPKPPIKMPGMPAEQQEIDLRSLITEQKRLLRETHRSLSLAGTEQQRMLEQTAFALRELVQATSETLEEIRADLAAAGGEQLIQLFELAMQEDGRAADLLEQAAPADSLQPQGVALSALLRIENALRRNIQSENSEAGESGQGSSGEQSGEQQQKGEPSGEQQQQLEDALRELEELASQQNERNAAYQRAAETDWSAERARNEAARQRELRQRSRELRSRLQSLADAGDVRAALSEAGRQMEEAAGRADSGNPGGALRSGLRAREALRQAQASLSELAAEASTRALRAAAQAAAELAENQSRAAAQSARSAEGDPQAPSLEDQEAGQRALKEALDELLQGMNQQSRQAAQQDPQMAKALSEAASAGRQSGASSRMSRAANALLYGQAQAASEQQQQAAESLRQWSEQIKQAARELASDPSRQAARMARQLGQTLEELAAYARDPELMPENRLPEIRKDWSGKLNELQDLTGQQQFGRMAQGLGGPLRQDWQGTLSDTRAILGQAARSLQQLLDENAARSALQLNREAAPPPEEYRDQVEAYFRNLAREPEN